MPSPMANRTCSTSTRPASPRARINSASPSPRPTANPTRPCRRRRSPFSEHARVNTVNILGISAFYHDSAACLVRDGEIVAAAQEERFTRKKHDYRFPQNAIDYCLAEGRVAPRELDFVAFYDKPLLKFERLIETYLAYAPVGFKSFLTGMPLW